MLLDDASAYRAIVAHDARFDGRLFVGVTSTGIYCRPVCRVRTPRPQHCRFFANAASAEHAGFRPCLRCRPELAPGLSLVDSPQALAQHAARLIAHAASDGQDLYVGDIAARLGITERHLRRIFVEAHGVSPLDYLTTQRLLLAKQLLTDTSLPVTQVALASGYASVRRFNHAFASRYRLTPSALRRDVTPAAGRRAGTMARAIPTSADAAQVRLGWRPPLAGAALMNFFARRALPGVELVVATGTGLPTLRRTLALSHRLAADAGAGGPQVEQLTGWIEARLDPTRHELVLRVAPSLLPVLGRVIAQVRHAFDLDADPSQIDPALTALPGAPGTRVPGSLDGFETAMRVILGQQITVAAARTLAVRLVQRLGEPITTPFSDLDRLFPSATAIANADPEVLGRLGIVRQRVRALQALAGAIADGSLVLHPGAPLEPTLAALRALPGVGDWTADVIALRVLGWPDAFPSTDIGVLKALGTRQAAEALAMAQAWQPWRSYAVMRLWQSLETGT